MNLTIDIGNTCTKITVFDKNSPVHTVVAENDLRRSLTELLQQYVIDGCAWCTVRNNENEIRALLEEVLPCKVLQLRGDSDTPLPVTYKSRHTLGADRLAAVLGASTLAPGQDLLVIDAGTCITYDLVERSSGYVGGNISPGVEMRLKALEHFTARLPKVEAKGLLPRVGEDTETAIRCGVVKGIAYEIEGYVKALRTTYPAIKVFFTGGNGLDLHVEWNGLLPVSDPCLVSRGLNCMLADESAPRGNL